MQKEGGAEWRFATRCVRFRNETFEGLGSIAAPIYQTSAFTFPDVAAIQRFNAGERSRYMYSRYANPTVEAVERTMASLESGPEAVLFSSGQAATSATMLSLVRTGDEILSSRSIYGGTRRLFQEVLSGLGVAVRYFGPEDLDRLDRLAGPRTRLIFAETPTNPTLEVMDISSLALAAHGAGIPLAVDSTFATPCNQNPLLLGADLVIHSATKYLGGHSDLLAGVVVGSRELIAPIREIMKIGGGCADPLAAFLLQRGLKTLALRIRAQNSNAHRMASFLAANPRVTRVCYPGLESHPGHAVARRQMRGYGGMVAFDMEGGFDAACRVLDRFRIFLRAATLGGVESNAMMPVLASHAGLSEDELSQAGVGRGMIRLSVGIEDPEDLLSDLEHALGGMC
jgi:cystathionine beta-lyase/cystathionine gamma-synthase